MRDRGGWAPVVTCLIVLAMTGITAAVSYQHEYQLAWRNGQAPWVSSLLPFTVDGMILVASVALLWAGSNGIRRPVRPLAVLAVGVGATIAANLSAGLQYVWLQRAVSAWCGVAVVLVADVAFWMLGVRRKLASGESVNRAAACSHPPLPLTLADWAPLAREWLKDHGETYGETALADRMSTTRHQVKLALAAADAPPAEDFPPAPPGVPHSAAVAAQPPPGASGVPPRPPVLNGSGRHG